MASFLAHKLPKLGKKFVAFSITPVKSCPNCVTCAKTCYANLAYRLYPTCKARWDYNFHLAQTDIPALEAGISGELRQTRKPFVRIHVSGDFFSQDYVDMWERIIQAFPNKRFYAYTKAYPLFDFSRLESLPNMNLINSFINGKLNYGKKGYCAKLIKDEGGFPCPAVLHDNVHCDTCLYCINQGKKPVFLIHGGIFDRHPSMKEGE